MSIASPNLDPSFGFREQTVPKNSKTWRKDQLAFFLGDGGTDLESCFGKVHTVC
jgi:hypothetical protein